MKLREIVRRVSNAARPDYRVISYNEATSLSTCALHDEFPRCEVRWVSIHSNEPTNKMAILAIGEEEPVY